MCAHTHTDALTHGLTYIQYARTYVYMYECTDAPRYTLYVRTYLSMYVHIYVHTDSLITNVHSHVILHTYLFSPL